MEFLLKQEQKLLVPSHSGTCSGSTAFTLVCVLGYSERWTFTMAVVDTGSPTAMAMPLRLDRQWPRNGPLLCWPMLQSRATPGGEEADLL